MPLSTITPQRHQQGFSRRALLPISIVTVGAVLLAVATLFWAVRHTDRLSVDRQIRTTRHAIESSIEDLAKQQQTVAEWDQAVLELTSSFTNWQWINDEMGVWLYTLFGHDQVYILNPQDEAVYVMMDGALVATSQYLVAQPDLYPLVRAARDDIRRQQESHRSDRTRPHPIGRAAQFLEVLGRPAVASATTIISSTKAVVQEPGSEFVIVSVRFLGGRFLAELSSRHSIDQPRFSRFNTALSREQSLPLVSDQGQPVGYFIWEPELPGTEILRIVGPAAILVTATVIILLLVLIRSLSRSVKELQASEASAQHLAYHDALTGLPNRALFDQWLGDALFRARRGENVALLMLDLDGFKHVNDTLGHQAGDHLIRSFAQRLSGALHPSEAIARIGGDEFAIIQTEIKAAAEVEALCSRIFDVVRQPFSIHGNQAFIGVSIGVATAPEAGLDPIELMRKADIALYHAKAEGRDVRRYFADVMDQHVKLRARIEDDLRSALKRERGLKVLYQPQVSAADGTIIGLEALVRWHHPTHGLILPDQFIPIAEETGLIVPLGEWVLRQACETSLRWPHLFMAVNLSAKQFHSNKFAERVIKIVRDSGADPRRIELEITESVLLGDPATREALKALREAGFRIALDDFGTGHSSLGYLRQFEVDKIKIDRSFIKQLGQGSDKNSGPLVEAIVALGHTMGLTVTAEGIETDQQREFLASRGCNELQGFLFSEAVTADAVADLIRASMRPVSKAVSASLDRNVPSRRGEA
ncbi:putative bifunctional diguanylate cyclase/phosphodiesterase [Microvirga subterranea]|uniref:Periplasmic sensor diguanylate cyclase/phosphodiesterase n=1 Tax=Microvirga subterranea TaxID=186651 RepID=A0A370H2Q5_9HYPH|nr:EAL domain-containing protein [Microvirga subterranea]RDI50391.1 periplasmic sensor diguanylate cyclase/phosphodiesterase [Microvirga subterranea]